MPQTSLLCPAEQAAGVGVVVMCGVVLRKISLSKISLKDLAVAVTGRLPPSKQLGVYMHPNWFWWAALVRSKTLPGASGPLKNEFTGCVSRFL